MRSLQKQLECEFYKIGAIKSNIVLKATKEIRTVQVILNICFLFSFISFANISVNIW